MRETIATTAELLGDIWNATTVEEAQQASIDAITLARNTVVRRFYQNVTKRVFFLQNPEDVHDRMTRVGVLLGERELTQWLAKQAFYYAHPSLRQRILGITFDNPIGLSAGFDKDARLMGILPNVGFGFAEVGSITGEPCAGNPKPRLWRLKKSKSIAVYYGLNNDGCEAIAARLRDNSFRIPMGMSIAKTNSPDTVPMQAGIDDYVKAYRELRDIGSYDTINISCPNAYGGEPFTDPDRLDALLAALNEHRGKKPMFIKLSPDLTEELRAELVDVAEKHRIDGYVCTNLTKTRESDKILDIPPNVGGLSGKVVEEAATQTVRSVYQQTEGRKVIIGVGGVFSAKDAYEKIKAGASLIQMITGMIFEGPQVISEINQGLVRLLERDGYKSVGEAVGSGLPTSRSVRPASPMPIFQVEARKPGQDATAVV